MFTRLGQLITHVPFLNIYILIPEIPQKQRERIILQLGKWKSVLFQVREVLCLHMSEILKKRETKTN